MKKLMLIIAAVFLFGLVSASVTQNNIIDYGINESNGLVTIISTLTNSNVIAYNCSTSDCSAGGPVLFGPTNIPGSNIVLTYPTSLAGLAGYGLYFYKDGYIPFEAFANWYGTGTPADFRPYLTKQRICTIPLSSLGVSYVGGNIVVNANVDSPIKNAGQLNYIPAALASQYSVNVQVNLTISGTSGYSEVKTVNIPFSNTAGVSFTNAFGDGSYNISVIAGTNDKCISSSSLTLSSNNFVINVVAPGSISNIQAINRTNNTISWNWTKPSDNDFNGTLLYLNGNNVVNFSNSVNQYTNSSLIPNTAYNLTVYTLDTAGNINWIGISNITSTLPNSIVPPADTIAPASVSGLINISTTNTTIVWNWTNPSDSDFNGTMVFINGSYFGNLTKEIHSFNLTNLTPNSAYNLTIYTFDNSSNINWTGASLITYTSNNTGSGGSGNDTIAPVLNVVSPTNVTYIVNPILVNFSATDNVALSLLWFFNGTANVSYTSPVNLNLTNGNYNFIFYANDSSGNINLSSVMFSVNIGFNDTVAPGISIVYPTNTTYTVNVTSLNYIVSDNIALSSCWYTLNSGIANTSIICGNNISGLLASQGSNNWIVYANDSSGNINLSSVSFFVNTSSGSGGGDDNNGGGGGGNGKTKNLTSSNYVADSSSNKIIYGTSDDSSVITLNKAKRNEFNWWPWIILLLVLMIILVLLLILVASRKKKKKN